LSPSRNRRPNGPDHWSEVNKVTATASTWELGDLIATGTPKGGGVVRCEIGAIENTVAD
jgi:hypothetical protein